MTTRFFPAVLERAAKKTFAAWLPDFPDCVAAGTSQELAIEKAQRLLAQAVVSRGERDLALPEPTALDAIEKPRDFLAFVMVKVEPPNPSERVNIYLPKNLIARIDQRASELGMSRSSFFGLAANMALTAYGATGIAMPLPAAARTEKRKTR